MRQPANDHLARIDRFRSGQMSEKESEAFLQDLARDRELAQEYNLVQDMEDFLSTKDLPPVKEEDAQRLNTLFDKLRRERLTPPAESGHGGGDDGHATSPRTGRRQNLWVWMAVAAAVLLLVGVMWVSGDGQDSQKELAVILEKHFGKPGIRPRSDADNMIKNGIEAFDRKDYRAASNFFKQYTSIDPTNEKVQFALAKSYFLAQDTPNAIAVLQDSTLQRDYPERTRFYLIIIYFHTKDPTLMETGKALLVDLAASEVSDSYKSDVEMLYRMFIEKRKD